MPFVGLSAGRITPTVEAILQEAFQRSGYATPSVVALARARDHWLEEVLRDIGDEKRWHTLEQTVVLIPQANTQAYDLPAPLRRILRMRFYDGDEKGTAAGGTITSITLDQDVTAAMYGKKVFLTGGTGSGQVNRITGSGGGAVALVADDWVTVPDATTTFMVASLETPVLGPVLQLPQLGVGPANLITHWQEFDNRLLIWPLPNLSTYALELDGVADVNTFDTTLADGARLTRILREWRRAIIYGLMIKVFENDDDERAVVYEAKYEQAKLRIMKADSRQRRGIGPVAMRSVGGMPRRHYP